jgi:hypothetical protein
MGRFRAGAKGYLGGVLDAEESRAAAIPVCEEELRVDKAVSETDPV